MAFARSFVALVALLCFAVVAVVRAQAASGDVTKLQIGVKVRAGGGGGEGAGRTWNFAFLSGAWIFDQSTKRMEQHAFLSLLSSLHLP